MNNYQRDVDQRVDVAPRCVKYLAVLAGLLAMIAYWFLSNYVPELLSIAYIITITYIIIATLAAVALLAAIAKRRKPGYKQRI